MKRRFAFFCLLAACAWPASGPTDDVILRAMRDELARARGIHLVNLDPPYFISYSIEDNEVFSVMATLGGVVNSRVDRFRNPEVEVRVGDYKFDNTNFVGSGMYGGRYEGRLPLENDYTGFRRFLWLATDGAYKAAVEAISRKRAALKNMAISEQIDDFAHAEPVRKAVPGGRQNYDEARWTALARSLSAIFDKYPKIRDSGVEIDLSQDIHYQVNSEGTELRYPERLAYVRVRATAQAPDGMNLHDAIVFHSLDFDRFASEAELRRGTTAVAENLTKLVDAPVGEDYNGPILFEGVASAQLVAEVLARNLALTRRPVSDRGRNGMSQPSELEGRQGSRIMPEFMSVVNDPTQTEWRGRPLFGHYDVDREGVVPQPLALVDKGVLNNFLLTRQPVRGFSGSNGAAILPGLFGASTAGIGNLFVKASETVPVGALRKKLIEMCANRGKPYGIVVRKLDFPSSASFQEIRQLLSRGGQSGGPARVSLPVMAYRVYPDGHEELVRGVRFGGVNARSLKDIVAAGDDDIVFDFLENGAPFAVMGTGGFIAEAAIIAPSLLIDDLELHKMDEELPKLPIVPAP
jgi:hypothetical protein